MVKIVIILYILIATGHGQLKKYGNLRGRLGQETRYFTDKTIIFHAELYFFNILYTVLIHVTMEWQTNFLFLNQFDDAYRHSSSSLFTK